ncbi:MAG: hypothetical protein IKJ62_02320 [Alphaproteobacteria bacterium]|nr:hypothetical protein [Alphaproteobacteria bacterium]
MAFTQEKLININPKQVQACVSPGDRCDGCEDQCKLNYLYCPWRCHIYPTIGGQKISHYIDENHKIQSTCVEVIITKLFQHEKDAKLLAGEIAKLCDHYKTR